MITENISKGLLREIFGGFSHPRGGNIFWIFQRMIQLREV